MSDRLTWKINSIFPPPEHANSGQQMNSHQSKAVWRLEWLAMATGSPGPTGTTGTTGPRPWPTPSWKAEELSGLGEGTAERHKKGRT